VIKSVRAFPDLYRDSVTLMQLSSRLAALDGVAQASAVVASPGNLELLRAAGLIEHGGNFASNDLVVAIEGEPNAVEAALEAVPSMLSRGAPACGGARERSAPRSIEMALAEQPGSNLALISTPGAFAAAEARKALALGLNVMMFSDNVDLADEIALKRLAEARGLLLMGPDCGTAIIDGVPLGFANSVRRGAIGTVAASGTGLQQVTCLVDRRGQGISQAIGTGGRDLAADVGGITMLCGLAALGEDPDTRVIVLVSKPPAAAVADRVLDAAARVERPVVVSFLGATLADRPADGVYAAATLDEAAAMAVALAETREPRAPAPGAPAIDPAEAAASGALEPRQRFVRGLFSGGTFCYESLLLLGPACGEVWSNTPVDPTFALDDPWTSRGHTVVDLGDDVFTRGRPHPMIDLALRTERIVAEARDPEVAVVLLDVVLGHGSHPDPAGELAPAIEQARSLAARDGRSIAFVASVCGTEGDAQGLVRQESRLRDAGVLLAESNAAAARVAARIATHGACRPDTRRAERAG